MKIDLKHVYKAAIVMVLGFCSFLLACLTSYAVYNMEGFLRIPVVAFSGLTSGILIIATTFISLKTLEEFID